MDQNTDTLVVQQKKEWGEILTGFETKNKYSISDPTGKSLLLAAEESALLVRLFLKSLRPYKIHILTPQGTPRLKLIKPFRFYFHEVQIVDDIGKPLGTIKRQLSLFSKRFSVIDPMAITIFSASSAP